jgi:hypothetical protein
MDAYLSLEAELAIKGFCILGKRSEGFLIGHRRGHRYFVENVFPTEKGFFPSKKKFDQMNQLFRDKVLGFYAMNPDEKTKQKILAPFAYGMAFLEIIPGEENKTTMKSFIIEYEGYFFLSPVPLVFPKSK